MRYTGGNSDGGPVALRAPTAQVLTLVPNQVGQLSWTPEDRRQQETEWRARVIALTPVGIGSTPIVRYAVEAGHGDYVWTLPSPQLKQVEGSPVQLYSLPGRGMVFRLNVREARLGIALTGTLAGPVVTSVTIAMSVQPCTGMQRTTLPDADLASPVGGTIAHALPQDAREWRATTALGLPVPAATIALGIFSLGGTAVGLIDAADLADWRPIPHDGATWLPSATLRVAFR